MEALITWGILVLTHVFVAKPIDAFIDYRYEKKKAAAPKRRDARLPKTYHEASDGAVPSSLST
jgi:hypothetical protein